METSKQTQGFESNLDHCVKIPADFLDKISVEPFDRDMLVLLLEFFSQLSRQEKPAETVEKFVLLDALLDRFYENDKTRFDTALKMALDAQLLIALTDPKELNKEYLLPGTPDGRTLFDKLSLGEVSMNGLVIAAPLAEQSRPNIFQLYEANIGPLTPITAEMLKEDEKDFPVDWIEDAIREAVLHNVRKWDYIRAILKNWKEKGRDSRHEKDGSNLEEFRRLYQEHKRQSKR